MLYPSKEGSLFGQVAEGLVAWVAGGARVCSNSNDACAVGQFRTDD